LVTTIKKATKLIVAFAFPPKSSIKISFTGGANIIKKWYTKKILHTILKQFIMKQQI
jgi:hypothetical protein